MPRHLSLALLIVVAATSLTACQEQPEPLPDQQQTAEETKVDTAAIRSSLDSLGEAVGRALDTGDPKLFAATWAEEGIMSAPGSPPIRGRDAITSAFKERPPVPPGGTLEMHPIEMRVLNAEWAYVFGVDTLTYTPEGAQEPVTETSTFLALLRKTPDGWKTYREVLSSNQPPPGGS